ncbi:MAG: hypothetical protein HYT37_02970 [Candidatus Sungbacteria bacterium]|nr:hypothetical protein [Candidatus Sungbacteria bacterium]
MVLPKKAPMVLGIHVKHDASVALCSSDGVVAAVAEERISRIKHHCGFPRQALETVLKTAGVSPAEISAVAFTTRRVLYPEHKKTFSIDAAGKESVEPAVSPSATRAWAKRIVYGESNDHKKKTENPFPERHWLRFQDYLKEIGLMRGDVPFFYIAHHRAHAASAFRLSGFSEACVVTLDGVGDGLCGTIYKGSADGTMELLRSSAAKDSLGHFYQAVTEALGFVPVDGEYKTMGLAAFADPHGENPFRDIVRVEDGVMRSNIHWNLRDFNKVYPEKALPNPLISIAQADEFKKYLDTMTREDFSYYAQEHCEKNMADYVRDATRLTASKNIAAAGGVMLNVKGNARIRDELKPDNFFVFPDSGDSGLAAGAAMEALYQMDALKGRVKFGNPYLGHEFSDDEIKKDIDAVVSTGEFSVQDATPMLITEKLIQGKVIGTFHGRLEMGPRALGNRSVLADPRNNAVKDRINKILKGREPFVPFAPSLMEEEAHRFWEGGGEYRYMTFAVPANDFAKKEVPAVVHVDGTMRPQTVSKEWNPWFYDILKEFKAKTGIGLLLNTSFNRHGLPIVGSPRDALEHLVSGWVDGVVVGEWYVEGK